MKGALIQEFIDTPAISRKTPAAYSANKIEMNDEHDIPIYL